MARAGRLLGGLFLGLLVASQLVACSGAGLANALTGAPPPSPTPTFGPLVARAWAVPLKPTPVPGEVSAVIALTNQYRTANGCPALKPNATLMTVAQAHSEDMAVHRFFAHTSSTGQTPSQRIRAAGYAWIAEGENIAAGYPTAAVAVSDWFNETPPNDAHRQNILNCRFRDVGVGYYYLADDHNSIAYHTYWTEDFGALPGE